MAVNMNNLADLYETRTDEAFALLDTDQPESIRLLEEMAREPYITTWYLLKIHLVLASLVEPTVIARQHCTAARQAFNEIYQNWPRDQRSDAHPPGHISAYADRSLRRWSAI